MAHYTPHLHRRGYRPGTLEGVSASGNDKGKTEKNQESAGKEPEVESCSNGSTQVDQSRSRRSQC